MKSYIDLYTEHLQDIKQHSSALLNDFRQSAFERFCALGIPKITDEKFQNINLTDAFAMDYGLNLNRLPITVNNQNIYNCNVPGISAYLFFVVNDKFYASTSNPPLPQGVTIGSINTVAEQNPELLKTYLGKLAAQQNNGLVALNEMFAQDGFFIHIAQNVKLEKPIQIVNIMRSNVDFMANSHNLVVLENNAKAQVLVCDHTADEVRFLENRITEVFVGENAVYEHYKIENTNRLNTNIAALLVEQKSGSEVLANIITLHNGITRNTVEINLEGEHCKTVLCGMVVSDKTQNIDNYTVINHNKPNCESNENFKYVLDEDSICGFTGKIFVAPNAQKTAAYQNNKNLLLTRNARIITRPNLEIYADDVKCSHGATTGQLDQEALFYLRSRGISQQEARLLLLYAFTSDIVDNIRIETLRDRIKMMIERRLRGEQSKCDSCAIC